MVRLCLCAFLIFFLVLGVLPSQGQRFTVAGRVLYEPDLRPADMVTVALRNFTSMEMERTNTDANGSFLFSVPRGVYYLNVRVLHHAEVNERVEVGVFSTSGIILYLNPLSNPRNKLQASGAVAAEYLKIPVSARQEYEQGMKLFQREGKLDEALLHLRRAVQIHPQFALAHNGMGMLLIDLNRLEKAREAFERAIAENEKLILAYFPLGAIYNQRGEFAKAEQVLREGLKIKETVWQLHFELARAIAYQGRWEEAENSARRALELNDAPTGAKVNLLLANIYFELEKDDLALAEAQQFLKKAPDDPLAPEIRRRVEAMRGIGAPTSPRQSSNPRQ